MSLDNTSKDVLSRYCLERGYHLAPFPHGQPKTAVVCCGDKYNPRHLTPWLDDSLSELSTSDHRVQTPGHRRVTSSPIRLLAIESLGVNISNYISRRAVQAYWTATRDACSPSASIHLDMITFDRLPLDGPELTLGDLQPFPSFVTHVSTSICM